MTADESASTPLGVRAVSVLFGLYGLFWLLTWVLASSYGNAALMSLAVGAGVLALATLLYAGRPAAWALAVVVLAASTLWRLSLVVNGQSGNVPNAAVGVLLVVYLLSQYEHFTPVT